MRKDLTQFLVDLIDGSKEIVVRENETIHDLTAHDSSMSITDIDATFEEHTGGTYKWGPDADAGIYNFSQWS